MRRAVLATMLCAAPLLAAPAHASGSAPDGQALREAVRMQAARASGTAIAPPQRAPLASAAAAGALDRVAAAAGPVRVLVGVGTEHDLDGVAALLERLGARPRVLAPLGVVAARVPSGAAAARALSADRRVAYVERDVRLRAAAEPFDAVDPDTGIKYTWAYDSVRAADALAASKGGSRRTIAVIDSGADLGHPELAGRVSRTYDTTTGGTDVTDTEGHGTFVAGLISAVDGNGIGGKGVAGATKLLVIDASTTDGCPADQRSCFTLLDLLRGIVYAVRHGADVINMSLAAPSTEADLTMAQAMEYAYVNDVLPVAAAGNTGSEMNEPQLPAALIGGVRGRHGVGLSVAATLPNGRAADFSTYNRYVSLAAPGAGYDCTKGVLSTLPAFTGTEWDVIPVDECPPQLFALGGARFAYGRGTSFSSPIAAGIAALAWQVEPRLQSEQVADVLMRSANQTVGRGWNSHTGTGVVDGRAGTALARRYDVVAPRGRARARRLGTRVSVSVARSKDRSERGHELAGHVRYGLLVSRDGGRSYSAVVGGSRRPFNRAVRLRGTRPNVFVATACDRNGNCAVRRLGRFKP